MSDWYQTALVDTGRAPTLWALLAFLITFGITRGITRRIRAKRNQPQSPSQKGGLSDIVIGGVHIHHQVWGIGLLLLTGLLEFRYEPSSPWVEVLATLFGVGAALVLDEFALWLHLDDVYWSEEGRKSIDAVLMGAALALMLLFTASPLGASSAAQVGRVALFVIVGINLSWAVVSFLKGKIYLGLVGVFIPTFAAVGALRLAKPHSPWAKRRYDEHKMARATARFDESWEARRIRLRDAIGGTPYR
ncbi:MAG: hypothetical protein ACKOD2_05225 [Ilumatobacteraceae bacterium]